MPLQSPCPGRGIKRFPVARTAGHLHTPTFAKYARAGVLFGKEGACMEPKTIIGIALVVFIIGGLLFLRLRKK